MFDINCNMFILKADSLHNVFSHIQKMCKNSDFEETRQDIIDFCEEQLKIIEENENEPLWISY